MSEPFDSCAYLERMLYNLEKVMAEKVAGSHREFGAIPEIAAQQIAGVVQLEHLRTVSNKSLGFRGPLKRTGQ